MKSSLINIGGRLLSLEHPCVMGIVNVTPDSFAISCRTMAEDEIIACAGRALQEGAAILDIGGYSSRPGADCIDVEEEWRRVETALRVIRSRYPDAVLSVDTFRAEVARRAVTQYGVQIINDISGGELDPLMFQTISRLPVAYVLMHMRGTPETMAAMTYYSNLLSDVLAYFVQKVDTLHQLGVRDVIIDPGLGFAKTVEQNYDLLRHLSMLQVLELPILVGLSRKSMINKVLQSTPQSASALTGTIAANMLALQGGANILRVHDVQAAVDTIKIYEAAL